MTGRKAEDVCYRIGKRSALVPSGCWEWTGFIRRDGYAGIKVAGKTVLAHRASYTSFVGPIPEGLTIDHLCRNPKCVNPLHLEAVTGAENTRRACKPHCKRGHEFTEQNTYAHGGKRHCRKCGNIRSAEYKRRAA